MSSRADEGAGEASRTPKPKNAPDSGAKILAAKPEGGKAPASGGVDKRPLALVPLPLGNGWHYANVHSIIAVKHVAPKKSVVYLDEGVQLEVSEDSHVINKRIEDFNALQRGS
jgi:hypothetical protein